MTCLEAFNLDLPFIFLGYVPTTITVYQYLISISVAVVLDHNSRPWQRLAVGNCTNVTFSNVRERGSVEA